MRAVDRLLIAALIECVRAIALYCFSMASRIAKPADFFGSLFELEASHHSTYVRLAELFAPEARVTSRLEELAVAEAAIIEEGEESPRVHS